MFSGRRPRRGNGVRGMKMMELWEDINTMGRHISGGLAVLGIYWGGVSFVLFGTMHDDGVLGGGLDHVSTSWSCFLDRQEVLYTSSWRWRLGDKRTLVDILESSMIPPFPLPPFTRSVPIFNGMSFKQATCGIARFLNPMPSHLHASKRAPLSIQVAVQGPH